MSTAENHNFEAAISNLNAASMREDIALVGTLGLKPFLDGDKYCFLWGENLHEGCVGFGDTVQKAARDFQMNFYNQTAPIRKTQEQKQ